MDKYIGRLLDNRYEILEVIGVGGMAVVYKAKCHRLNRLVAIKILKDDFLEDEDFRSRFHAEGQAVAMLGHPNIVNVYDVSTTAGVDYIVMELIEGITLKQYIEKKGVLNWKETLHFATEIAKALEHAHSRGIVHRDIKPHNVMVLKNGDVKVADFGIARMIAKGNTLTKEALGSVHYISPEQAKGEHVDERSDIYSLGIVMYEMITGKQPYEGTTPVNVALQHINGGAVHPSILNTAIPTGLEQIIMKAMAHAPDNRYSSATEMLQALDEFRKNPTIQFAYSLHAVPMQKPPTLERPRVVSLPEQPKETTEEKKPVALPNVEKKKDRREEKHSGVAKIAIIVCVVAIILAICVFVVLAFGGGFNSGTKMATVPSLIGKRFDDLPLYPGIKVSVSEEIYDPFYEAGVIVSQDIEENSEVARGTTVYVTLSKGREPHIYYMIDVVNFTKTKAKEELEKLYLRLNIVFDFDKDVDPNVIVGRVTRTVPAAGEKIEEGDTVIVYISKPPEVVKNEMVQVIGLDIHAAMALLKANKFENIVVVQVESNAKKDSVVTQSVPKGEKIDITTEITLEISLGPPETIPPTTEETVPPEPGAGGV